MWNEPSTEELALMPSLYSTENVPLEAKAIVMHFFIGGCDWYVAEYDPDERIFFGYAILNGDLQNAEWGYISFDELREIKVGAMEIDRDLHWQRRPAKEVDKIKEASGW